MDDLFLLVRPPRPLWPFNGPASAFWPPLAFASMAAALREGVPDTRVSILDAPALQMGWRGLEAEIRLLLPAYVGIGEEAVSCVEGLRLAKIAKACGARVIAGGCFYGHIAPEVLRTGLVDVVVHGEGEATIVELIQALRTNMKRDLFQVAGISFSEGERIVRTEPRPLLSDLDQLPFPAYDLLPVERYGRGSRNHPDLAAIELSRGCPHSCSFCVLWRQMGHFQGSRVLPRLRTKTPERLLEETRILVRRFGRRYLGWVDPCFNADPEVPGRLAELLLRDGIRIGQSAWVRADGIARDQNSGALPNIVRAGLNEVYIGIERLDLATLLDFNKGTDPAEIRKALRILSENYCEVFTVGSFIYGLPGDTPEGIREIWRLSLELDLDMALYIPLTPLPGTPSWRPELWDPTGARFRGFDFLPSLRSNGVRRPLERALLRSFAFDWRPVRIQSLLHRLSIRDSRKRRINWNLLVRNLRFTAGLAAEALFSRRRDGEMRLPAWYEG